MEILYQLAEALVDALKDSLIIIPFMLAAYLVIGAFERGGGGFMLRAVTKSGKFGPLIGGVLGAAPSCGFSAAAANLFGAKIISIGTLVAVFLSTSDEMLAVMLSNGVDILFIARILAIKVLAAVVAGFLIDFILSSFYKKKNIISGDYHIPHHCNDGCCAAESPLFISALRRTLRVVAFIVIISFAVNIMLLYLDVGAAAEYLSKVPVFGSIVAGLIGLIPNCAVSVAVTELYIEGIITAPVMLTALLAGAGSGILVLFRSNKSIKENLFICALIYIFSVGLGTAAGYILF